MNKKIEKYVIVIGWILTISSVLLLAWGGITRSFFHQDDVVALAVIADWKGWETVSHLNNEHLNITLWPVLRLMWLIFGTNYAPYLVLNILFHVLVMFFMFKIAYKLTKSNLWSSVAVWGFVINANWFTVVWWITGLMIMECVAFALIAYWLVLRIKESPQKNYLYPLLFIFSVLPGLSWGVGLTWPMLPLLVYGIDYSRRRINRIGWTLLATQITVGVIYFSLVGSFLGLHTDPKTWLTNPFEIAKFAIVGISNTLVGRWLMPFEKFRIRMFTLALALLIFLYGKLYKKMSDRNIIFGLVVVMGSFITYAIPRWRFGIGHAMANYYAYYPLAFLMIAVAVFLTKFKLTGWRKIIVLGLFIIHIPLSWLGFESWAKDWVVRPQETKAYFEYMKKLSPQDCLEDTYIPEYIVPQHVFKVSFVWPVFKKNWDPFCDY